MTTCCFYLLCRFHAYSVASEYEDNFDSFTQSLESDSVSQPCGRGRGDGMPSLRLGVGVREDVITLWEELDEARNTLAEIQALLCEIKDHKDVPSKSLLYVLLLKVPNNDDNYNNVNDSDKKCNS